MLNQEMKGLVSTLMIARKEFIEYKLLDSSSVPKEMWEKSTYSESCDVQEEANRCMGIDALWNNIKCMQSLRI